MKAERNADLTGFDRSESTWLSHWRGFTKYKQPDGKVIGCTETSADRGILIGPCETVHDVDSAIADFYNRN